MDRTAEIVTIGSLRIGRGCPLCLVAGPCVIESRDSCLEMAGRMAEWADKAGTPLVFKASYDKANRSSGQSFRGPGLQDGLETLAAVKQRYGLPVLTDVHAVADVATVAAVADVVQIPAFLCRQTDLIEAAAASGAVVNVKKGQFLAPRDVRHIVEKAENAGGERLMLTERGACFGYNELVADMRSLLVMRELGWPVLFDATHSVQRPGAAESGSSGDACWAPALARAAVATGCDGVFLETHPDPARAQSDRDNCIPLSRLPGLWSVLVRIHELVSDDV